MIYLSLSSWVNKMVGKIFQNFMLMQGHEMEKLGTLLLVGVFIHLFKFCYVLAHFTFPVCLIQICSLHLKLGQL